MKQGINRAELGPVCESAYERRVINNLENSTCVFISHKSSDSRAALEVANYLRDSGIDVYIDINDNDLQNSTLTHDAEAIVEHIQRALKLSTHILVLISDDTRNSWWVPYEIGYAKNDGKDIASLLLLQYNAFPDYLKIESMIHNISELEEYTREVLNSKNEYEVILENYAHIENTNLYQYIRG